MADIEIASVTKRFPNAPRPAVDAVDLHVGDGEFLVLVGPSGCGKSTLLRMIAGLTEVTEGTIRMGGRDVTRVGAADRDVAMVFQNYALYPHMTVRDNLAYGLKRRKTPKTEMRDRVAEVSRMLGLDDLLDRRPAQLSGGQRQRVAMGRAIARRPQAYLMDEPLSNLDAKLRVAMRGELTRLHERLSTTTVYVTHDQVEALTLGQRVAVMREGRLQQVGAPRQLYHEPVNVFVAGFIGSPAMNLVHAEADGRVARFGGFELRLPRELHGPVIVGIRPEDFADPARASDDAARIEVETTLVEDLGADAHVSFAVEARAAAPPEAVGPADEAQLLVDDRVRFVARVAPTTDLAPGQRRTFAIDPGAVHLFDADDGARLVPATTTTGPTA